MNFFTRCLLLFSLSFCLLSITFCSLIVNFCSLLITFCLFFASFIHYSSRFARYSLLFACYSLLIFCSSLLSPPSLLGFGRCSLMIISHFPIPKLIRNYCFSFAFYKIKGTCNSWIKNYNPK